MGFMRRIEVGILYCIIKLDWGVFMARYVLGQGFLTALYTHKKFHSASKHSYLFSFP